jgi:hypothetical protein
VILIFIDWLPVVSYVYIGEHVCFVDRDMYPGNSLLIEM